MVHRTGSLTAAAGGGDGLFDALRGQLVLFVELDDRSGIGIEDIALIVSDDHIQIEQVVAEIDLRRYGLLVLPLLVQRQFSREHFAPIDHQILHEEEDGPPFVVVGPVEFLADLTPLAEDGSDFLDDRLLASRHLFSNGRLLDVGFTHFDVAPRIDALESSIPHTVAEKPVFLLAEIVDRVAHFQFEAVGPVVLEIVRHWIEK